MAERPGGPDLDPFLLEVIVCPSCRGALTVRAVGVADADLVCAACALAYPIRDGVPVLLIDEAQPTVPTETAPPADPA